MHRGSVGQTTLAVGTLLLLAALLTGCGADEQKPAAASQPGSEETNARPSRAPHQKADAFVVHGRVTDVDGNPMKGVELVAHCGIGTLRVTGRALTDPGGRYRLHFGPGMLFMREPDGRSTLLQAATITPHKPGWCEANLARHGDLLMAYDLPDPDAAKWRAWNATRERVVLPEQPRELNFVMEPAARIEGRLVDQAGQPLADRSVWIDGDELPPSSSVLATATTDRAGRFVAWVPTRTWWFTLRLNNGPVGEVSSSSVRFERPEVYPVTLVLTQPPAQPARLDVQVQSPSAGGD